MTNEAKPKTSTKPKWREFKVDLWATDINDVEIGIMKDAEHRAQSRQFTKDMDVFGQVVEDGERTGLFGVREEIWNKETGLKKRLVIKLFSEKLNWQGSLDLMMGRSIQLSQGAGGFPAPAFSINLARHEQIIQLERSARKWPLNPEVFSFFILPEGEAAQFYSLRKKHASAGGDYLLKSQTGETIGHLDGKLVNLGGAWKVKVREGHTSKQLEATLKLFCAMLKYNDKVRSHIETQTKAIASGQMEALLDYQEVDLYMNPRRTR